MVKRTLLTALLLAAVTFTALSPAAEKNPPARGSKRFARTVVVSGLAVTFQ